MIWRPKWSCWERFFCLNFQISPDTQNATSRIHSLWWHQERKWEKAVKCQPEAHFKHTGNQDCCYHTCSSLQCDSLHMHLLWENIFNKLEWISCPCCVCTSTHKHTCLPRLVLLSLPCSTFIRNSGACQRLTPLRHSTTRPHHVSNTAFLLL